MKNPLLGLVLVLQIAVLALLGGQILRERQQDSEADPMAEFEQSLRDLNASLHQQRVFNDQLRRQVADLRTSESSPPAPAGEIGPRPRDPEALEDVPFPEAHRLMRKLQVLLTQRREAEEREESELGPFDASIQQVRSELLTYGLDALYWLNREATRQPYDTLRDPDLIEVLLRDLLPPLADADADTAFDIARDALLTVSNENRLRLAGAWALKQVDSEGTLWQKEYADVIRHGGSSNPKVTLRVALLNTFGEHPWEDAVPLCQAFVADVRQPLVLRTKSIQVLALQDSPQVEPILRAVLFEDHAPEMRLHALDSLHARLGDGDALRKLLAEVVDQDPATMHAPVQEKARRLLDR